MNEKIINPMVPINFMIDKVREETHDTLTIYLSPKNDLHKCNFSPGQFNMLYIFGVGEIPISISGDPSKPETLIHTIRKVGSVSSALHNLKEGDSMGVRGPFGSNWPVDKAIGKDVVIITGGIGLAPLRPAFYKLLANRDNYGKIALLYGARSPEDLLFQEELKEWRSQFDLQIRVTVDHSQDNWYGTVGVVTMLIPKARFEPKNTLAMVCGPEIMMRFTVEELKRCGMESKDIYISMERNMKCATGICGHCQYGPNFICKEGPVLNLEKIGHLFTTREV